MLVARSGALLGGQRAEGRMVARGTEVVQRNNSISSLSGCAEYASCTLWFCVPYCNMFSWLLCVVGSQAEVQSNACAHTGTGRRVRLARR